LPVLKYLPVFAANISLMDYIIIYLTFNLR